MDNSDLRFRPTRLADNRIHYRRRAGHPRRHRGRNRAILALILALIALTLFDLGVTLTYLETILAILAP